MSQLPTTDNTVNNREARDAGSVSLTLMAYDPTGRYVHFRWYGHVPAECIKRITEFCREIRDNDHREPQLLTPAVVSELMALIPMAAPIAHQMQTAVLRAYTAQTYQQSYMEKWQDASSIVNDRWPSSNFVIMLQFTNEDETKCGLGFD